MKYEKYKNDLKEMLNNRSKFKYQDEINMDNFS